jgi:prolyl-tRNA synthetase
VVNQYSPGFNTSFRGKGMERRPGGICGSFLRCSSLVLCPGKEEENQMRWSQLFIPTLRDVPADAEVISHKLLLRAGYIRQLGSGIYSLLPLARRSLLKIENIIREEMDSAGAQEFYLPALNPDDVWKASGRWDVMGANMFRIKDRAGRDLCLGMTHEEVFTSIAKDGLRSYRELPQIWYQIQLKFRDEARPKSGLLRVRQFTMKDSYSFDINKEGLDRNFDLHDAIYRRIFDRCGLKYTAVQAVSGSMGGSESQEFMVQSNAGEDWVVNCKNCGYAANQERANSKLDPVSDPDGDFKPSEIHTPGQKTIEDVAAFLGTDQERLIKSLVYIVESKALLLLLRGDHQLCEMKLAGAAGSENLRPATDLEIKDFFGADSGSLGPVGVKDLTILADLSLQDRKNMVCGANRDDYHLENVTPGKDFTTEFVDLREVQEGESCIKCGKPLAIFKTIEIGHIFKLGTKYSEAMGATVLDDNGKDIPVVMGSYGIGVDRILASAVELFNDENGMILPRAIAPFEVVITLLRPDNQKHLEFAEKLYSDLKSRGIDTILDDRDERPGVKFKDAELTGIPVRITVGRKLDEGSVEILTRADKNMDAIPADACLEKAISLLENYAEKMKDL